MSGTKLKTLKEISETVKSLRAKGKTVVHCHGVFDLIHPGHIRHFEAAKKFGDILVVTVTPDRFVNKGPGRPAFKEDLRAESIAALSFVDMVAINETPTAVEAIKRIQPNYYVKGSDYKEAEKDITGGIAKEEAAVRSGGGKLVFTNEITFSSTSLINNYFNIYPEQAKPFLQDFSKRYTADGIIKKMEQLKKLKVLAIGEAIIDQYVYCQAMGKSPKENIVSTRYVSQETFAGGTLAAANHLAGFVGDVTLVTGLGKDGAEHEKFIRSKLKPNVEMKVFQTQAPTIIKRRFVDAAFLTKMFEISYLEDKPQAEEMDKPMLQYLAKELPKYDMVFVTDYGHGFISQEVVDLLTSKSKFLAVNTQANSANFGYNLITKYPKANFTCIDEPEMRLAQHNKFGPLEDLMKDMKKKMKVENMIVTRGHNGSMAYAKNEFVKSPVFSNKIVDRTGAGDAFFSLAAPCVAAGFPMDLTSFIGNAAGALAVTIVCNREPIEPVAFYKFITALLK